MRQGVKLFAWGGILATAALIGGTAHAGKPSGGTGGGTVYWASAGLWTMNSDGTGKTQLPMSFTDSLVHAEGVAPSRALHGGRRWVLDLREVAGTYPSSPGAASNVRREIFARRDDGNETFTVQLTSQPDLETDGRMSWNPGDTAVSWVARRWNLSTPAVVDGGVYTAAIQFDASGNVVGLAAQPGAPYLAATLVVSGQTGAFFSGDPEPAVGGFDWSPDGSQIVYGGIGGTYVTVPGSTPRLLVGNGVGPGVAGGWPQWSPDGSKIAFGGPDISTISPNGTGLKTIARAGLREFLYGPRWSPTGSHVVFRKNASGGDIDVIRVTASGSGATNLTADVSTGAAPVAWR